MIFLSSHVTVPIITHSINPEKIRKKIKKDLELDFMVLHKMFHENHIVLNPGNVTIL